MSDLWLLAVFVGYFAVLIGIALVRATRMAAMSDYVLGGRRMGAFTSALSASSSGTSAWAILVFPALAFQHGLGEMWTALALVAGIWCSWTIIAKRLRRYTMEAGDALTMPEFLERRFADSTGALRTVAALVTIFFVVFYIASGLIAGAKLLETAFGLQRTAGVLATLLAVASYTFIGGFVAVSRTDVFQATMMLAALVVMPLWLIATAENPFAGLGAKTPGFWNPLTDREGEAIGAIFLLSAVGWGLGYLGSQRVVQRFMAVGSEAHLPLARNIGTAWMLLLYLFALLLGLVALPALAEIGRLEDVLADPKEASIASRCRGSPGVPARTSRNGACTRTCWLALSSTPPTSTSNTWSSSSSTASGLRRQRAVSAPAMLRGPADVVHSADPTDAMAIFFGRSLASAFRGASASSKAWRSPTSAGVSARASTRLTLLRHSCANQLSSTVLPLPRGPTRTTSCAGALPPASAARQRDRTACSFPRPVNAGGVARVPGAKSCSAWASIARV